MNTLRTGVFVLFGLLVPVSCSEPFFNDLVICYFLDAFLMVYCITATVFFFREKFSYIPPAPVKTPDANGGIYQELERPNDADAYQVLETGKRKKKAAKKKRTEATPAGGGVTDPFETLAPSTSAQQPAP